MQKTARPFRLKSRVWIVLVIALILVIAFFNNIVSYIIDYQWFSELNYVEVFFKKLFTQIQFFVPTLVILFFVFFAFLNSISAHSVKYTGIGLSQKDKSRRKKIFVGVSFLLSLFFSIAFVSNIWYEFLIFINKASFGIADPVFGKDIGFYIFTLPFFNTLYGAVLGLVLIMAVIAVLFNVFVFVTAQIPAPPMMDDQGNVRPIHNNRNIYKSVLGAASKQLMFLGGILFLVLGIGFYLRTFGLLYSARGVAYGASYTDIHVTLPSYYIYAVICLITAVFMMLSWKKKRVRLALFGPLLLIVAIIISGVASALVQSVVVTPNELATEEKYLQHNIDYTNFAYGLNKVVSKQFDVKQNLTRANLEANKVTVNNIPINDYRPAKDIYNQIQGLKNYYQFNDIDIDRYVVNNTYRQVFISARELQSANIPRQSQAQSASWINRYLKYTHGYGVAMSPVNEVTPSGQPRLFIRDMPLVSDVNINIEKPQIYFGELTKDFAVVNTREKEFDYPASNANVETTYQGTGGIRLSWLNRLLFAVKEGKMNFLLSQDINSQSKVLINREIKSRVQSIAPFLLYDDDPYVVTVGGKLYWIIDAYTVSSRYPYSEPINNTSTTNYIRNSVKVVIDAYNGTTSFYIADKNDPIIETYASIFKTLFKPMDAMPAALRAHIRYPQTLFDIQADIYKKYHMKTARDFYNKSDVWDIATQIYGASGQGASQAQAVESSYLIMRLPDSDREEFILMNPYTPQSKTNMIAWFGVKNDGEDYGKLVLYTFPSGKIVEGPMQVEGIVSQDTIIGPQLNLLATGGNSQVVRGNMLIIPVEESILYVEPIYVRAINANALPELKKVILFYKNQVVMEDTFEKALARIFPLENNAQPGQPSPTTPQTPTGPAEAGVTTVKDLAARANTLFQQAQESLKSGNWADYGNKIVELENVLKQLSQAAGQSTAPNPAPTTTTPTTQNGATH